MGLLYHARAQISIENVNFDGISKGNLADAFSHGEKGNFKKFVFMKVVPKRYFEIFQYVV